MSRFDEARERSARAICGTELFGIYRGKGVSLGVLVL